MIKSFDRIISVFIYFLAGVLTQQQSNRQEEEARWVHQRCHADPTSRPPSLTSFTALFFSCFFFLFFFSFSFFVVVHRNSQIAVRKRKGSAPCPAPRCCSECFPAVLRAALCSTVRGEQPRCAHPLRWRGGRVRAEEEEEEEGGDRRRREEERPRWRSGWTGGCWGWCGEFGYFALVSSQVKSCILNPIEVKVLSAKCNPSVALQGKCPCG